MAESWQATLRGVSHTVELHRAEHDEGGEGCTATETSQVSALGLCWAFGRGGAYQLPARLPAQLGTPL
jgi:hypothetical protein